MSEPPASFAVHQEDDEIPSSRVAVAAGAWMSFAAVGVVVAGAILVAVSGALRPAAPASDAGEGPLPAGRTISGVEQTPILDWKAGIDLRERQRAELEVWGWADRDGGVARIPIDQAIDVVVSEQAR